MSNIFNGFNIGLRALQTQKKSLDITGHNIANANNEEYSRQRAIHSATKPRSVPGMQSPGGPGQIGTGVEIEKIERIKDVFIDQQIREESQEKGYWDKLQQGLERIEFTFNEPSDSSLKTALNLFWNSLQDLSNRPVDTATRQTVKSRASVLTDSFHTLYDQLMDYKSSLNTDVRSKVDKINSIARRIGDLNNQITSIISSDQAPNDLLDKRDALFNELNQLINVQGRTDQMGGLSIAIGGVRLVSGSDVNELTVETEQRNEFQYEDRVLFANTGEEVNIESGEMKGIIDVRDREIDEYIYRLDNIAAGLAERFNEVHQMGYDLAGSQGNQFFEIADNVLHASASIKLTDEIAAEGGINKIAAGNYSDSPDVATAWNESADSAVNYRIKVTAGDTTDFKYEVFKDNGNTALYSGSVDSGEEIDLSTAEGIKLYLHNTGEANINFAGNEGSGTNGVALARAIKEDAVLEGASITQYYEAVISTIGVNTQRAEQMVNNQDALVNQLENLEESISGVSLDEEMTHLIKYQQAYNAAAKIITKTEEILDNLMAAIR